MAEATGVPAIDLQRFLEEEEILDLRELAKHRGWTPLLKLLRALEAEALRGLQGFRDANEAYEKRGYSRGVSLIVDVARTLYDTRTEAKDASNPSTSGDP